MKSIPFAFGKVVFGEEFTNREEETLELIKQFIALNNVSIISPRRWGKSSLVNFATKKLLIERDDYRVVYLDMFNIKSEEDFYKEYTEKILNATYSGFDTFIKKSGSFFKKLIPKLSFSPIPESEISVGLDWKEVNLNPSEILDLPQKIAISEGIKIVVCIDEFQNLQIFEKPLAFQKKMRAHWQHHANVSYCLYGSKENMMKEIFNDNSYPFYRFATILNLKKIKAEKWEGFIKQRFMETDKKINDDAISEILQFSNLQPFYVQQLAQTSWLFSEFTCTINEVNAAKQNILDQYHSHFVLEMERLVNSQVNLLKAICTGITAFGNAENIKKFDLKSTPNINRAKQALIEKQIIRNVEGKLEFLDAVFEIWLGKVYFKL